MAESTDKIQLSEFEQKLQASTQKTEPVQQTGPVAEQHQTIHSEEKEMTIPVIEEQISIDKEVVESATVNISKNVREEEVLVDIPTTHEEVDVKRVQVNQYVDAVPGVRHEGETMIIPVVREVLVVEKKLMVVEEIHVTKQRIQSNETQRITVLKEEVQINRTDS
ncbi:YsnF/AvaK domain-containing protein [Pontibacter arcticus]|nr:YsnF/AvaK domain-containing protein [Pontibacter arcticus]